MPVANASPDPQGTCLQLRPPRAQRTTRHRIRAAVKSCRAHEEKGTMNKSFVNVSELRS